MDRLQIIRGDTVTLNFTFTDENGNAIDLTNYKCYFTVKENKTDIDDNAKIQKDWTSHSDPTHGITSITLSSTDTNITPGNYYYDIQLKSESGEITSSQYNILEILQDITIRTT